METTGSHHKTLLVLRFSALGDVALIVPVLLAFTETYPDVRLIICTRPKFSPLFRNITNVEVLPAELEGEHQGIFGLYRLFRRIKAKKPAVILDLHSVLRTKIIRFYYAARKTPFFVLDKARAEKRGLTRATQKNWQPLAHTTERYAAVFAAAGFPIHLKDQYRLIGSQLQNEELKNILGGHRVIGIAPFAAHKAKMYDLEKMEQLVAWLNEKPNCKTLIFGGGSKEKQRVQAWEDRYSNCINLIGTIDFEEELNVIGELDLMVSMDSGNGHLSAIFGVPTITLWGVTHPYAGFAPFAQPETNSLLADRSMYPAIPTSIYGNSYPEGYEDAINTISVSQIQDRISSILEWI